MKKFSKIALIVLWTLTAIATVGTVGYVLADIQGACKWALFLPAIMAFVSTIATVGVKAFSKSQQAKAQAKLATNK